MPLYFSGTVIIYEVSTPDNSKPKAVVCDAAFVTCDGDFSPIALHCWVDDQQIVQAPELNHVFFLEAKLSYNTAMGHFVAEAMRMWKVRNIMAVNVRVLIIVLQVSTDEYDPTPMPARVFGTGVVTNLDGPAELRLQSSCFAANQAAPNVQVAAQYAPAQYKHFVDKLKTQREIVATGIVGQVPDGCNLTLETSDFSYLARTSIGAMAASNARKIPDAWPSKSSIKLNSSPSKPTMPTPPSAPKAQAPSPAPSKWKKIDPSPTKTTVTKAAAKSASNAKATAAESSPLSSLFDDVQEIEDDGVESEDELMPVSKRARRKVDLNKGDP